MNLSNLAAPFPPESIHWRAQTLTGDGSKALALAYLDARDVMDHLDRVLGAENWQDSYTETAKGRVICTIRIRIGEEWVGKSDGAGDTAVEGEKGGISDAFKRAAVKWGVGRYLYDLGNVWAPCETYERNGKKHWKGWKPEAQRLFADALRRVGAEAVSEAPPPPVITDDQRELLMSLFNATGINPAPYLKKAADNTGQPVSDLRNLPASEFEPLRDHLKTKPMKEPA